VIRHFYHVYASGAWAQPAAEHLDALELTGLPARITVGLVGAAADRDAFRQVLGGRFAALDPQVAWVEADDGFEQVTLAALHAQVRADRRGTVFYAHTKGAYSDTGFNQAWRRSMTRHCVYGWYRCSQILEHGGFETAGCHWITPEQFGGSPWFVKTPMYGGNFWWATACYLAGLPPPGTAERHQAEEWIGLGAPLAFDLLPGFPSRALFGEDA
jgi:hypothetical protein